MKKFILILMAFLPMTLMAQVAGMPLANGKTGLSELLNKYAEEDSRFSFFEVGEEMFKAFCELENADSTSIALLKKIKSVKMLELRRTEEEQTEIDGADPDATTLDPSFYQDITSQLDITGYNQLLKSRNNRSMALLLKKEFGPADNEFLLITDRMVIDIRGDIMIKTIYQMEEMMGYVQQILPN
ncbi:MAG: hypothetical protein WCW62_13335 [Bacteroidales bacterium]